MAGRAFVTLLGVIWVLFGFGLKTVSFKPRLSKSIADDSYERVGILYFEFRINYFTNNISFSHKANQNTQFESNCSVCSYSDFDPRLYYSGFVRQQSKKANRTD
jgi:hypothetical protein